MLPEDVSKVGEIIKKAGLELKSIEVNKKIALEIDSGNLLVSDINELDKTKFRNESEQGDYLKGLARDCVQALINKVWDLPSENINNTIYALLPKTTFRLPREKPVPKPKPPTKWELFAKEKGIKKKFKANKEWDDVIKEWVPRYGFRKVAAEKKKNWLMEVPDNADPYEDQYAKAAEAKKERIAKNEYLRLKNIARAKNVNVPNVGVTATNMSSSTAMETALTQTRLSTASLGKFQRTLPAEKPLFESKRSQKRKIPTNDTSVKGLHQDKKRALEVLGKMKKNELHDEAAVNKQIRLENIKMSHQGKKEPESKRRSKQGKGQGRKKGNVKWPKGKRVLGGNLAKKKKSEGKAEKGGGEGGGGKQRKGGKGGAPKRKGGSIKRGKRRN